MKKKLMALVMAFAMMLSMAACGGQSASDYVKAELDNVKNADADSLVTKAIEESGLDMNNESIQAFVAKLVDFDYEILGEEEDGDNTIVKVKINTYNFAEAFSNAYSQMMTDALSGNLGDISSEEIENRLYAALGDVTEKSVENEVSITCKKNDDGEWVGDFGSAFVDAVFGGLMSAIGQ